MPSRRHLLANMLLLSAVAVATAFSLATPAQAQDKTVRIGIQKALPYTLRQFVVAF